MGHHIGSDDTFLAFIRFAPLVFIFGGVLVVWWLSRQRAPGELQPDVLAAMSETEALPARTIRQRPPLDRLDIDVDALARVLDELCGAGLAIRWYETVDAERLLVYRRRQLAAATAD
ncbi:MAG TPA: hypothetical protein VGL99_09035 [Chloroflexota bacterium]|jgi:hypothetical protein